MDSMITTIPVSEGIKSHWLPMPGHNPDRWRTSGRFSVCPTYPKSAKWANNTASSGFSRTPVPLNGTTENSLLIYCGKNIGNASPFPVKSTESRPVHRISLCSEERAFAGKAVSPVPVCSILPVFPLLFSLNQFSASLRTPAVKSGAVCLLAVTSG